MPALFGESDGRGRGAVAQRGRFGLWRGHGTGGRHNGPCQQIVNCDGWVELFCESLFSGSPLNLCLGGFLCPPRLVQVYLPGWVPGSHLRSIFKKIALLCYLFLAHYR